MSRKQSVHIAHRDMDMHEIVPLYFHKRSTAYEKGPMWNFERDLSPATKTIANQISANNVKANMDRSNVKGYGKQETITSECVDFFTLCTVRQLLTCTFTFFIIVNSPG
jgi:hypothetical protein